jgi:hypothetical protein
MSSPSLLPSEENSIACQAAFPSHQSRENLLAITETKAGNSESDPNNWDKHSPYDAPKCLIRDRRLIKRAVGITRGPVVESVSLRGAVVTALGLVVTGRKGH